jgi:hypothetical protein
MRTTMLLRREVKVSFWPILLKNSCLYYIDETIAVC